MKSLVCGFRDCPRTKENDHHRRDQIRGHDCLAATLLLLASTALLGLALTLAATASADVHGGVLALGDLDLVVGLGDLEQDGAGGDLTLLDQDGLDQHGRAGLVVQDDWGLTHDHRGVVDEDFAWRGSHEDRGLTVQVDLLALLATATGPHHLGLGHLSAVIVVLIGLVGGSPLAGTGLLRGFGPVVVSLASTAASTAASASSLLGGLLRRGIIDHWLDQLGAAQTSLDALDQETVGAGHVTRGLLVRVGAIVGAR